MRGVYKAYMFRQKDPVIDQLRTIIQEENDGQLNGKILKSLEASGGPTASTMRNWFFGKTKRPQNPTAEAAGRAAGYHREWVKGPAPKGK